MKSSQERPAISRRSCDNCRLRKIGCDRGSPCSNCTTVHLECTHSRIATPSTASSSKRRILISNEYERKVDAIASDIRDIKQGLLQRKDSSKYGNVPVAHVDLASQQTISSSVSIPSKSSPNPPRFDHSAHTIHLLKSIIKEKSLFGQTQDQQAILDSMSQVVKILDVPGDTQSTTLAHPQIPRGCRLPLDTILEVLRWAIANASHPNIARLSRILPLQRFTDICRDVVFGVDGNVDYTDKILANGYLYYTMDEYASACMVDDFEQYSQFHEDSFAEAIARLPMAVPATQKAIAALTLGAMHAIDIANAELAWALISNAASMCKTLNYHCSADMCNDTETGDVSERCRLFWTVYRLEKGLSLRIGRPTNFIDSNITIPVDTEVTSLIHLAKIEGDIYKRLFSPAGLMRSTEERAASAREFARELKVEIVTLQSQLDSLKRTTPKNRESKLVLFHANCDLYRAYSLLAFVLRAITSIQDCLRHANTECEEAADQSMMIYDECYQYFEHGMHTRNEAVRFVHRVFLHTPAVSFSIVIGRAFHSFDDNYLLRMEQLTRSLMSKHQTTSLTEPYRLYGLICRLARLQIESQTAMGDTGPVAVSPSILTMLDSFDMDLFGLAEDSAAYTAGVV